MDYEKEYKEARERATKVIMKCRPLSTEANLAVHYALSYVFHATTESEDEKIRKAIVKMMKVPRKEIFEAEGITKEQALAYLEKQKEQKPEEVNVKALLTADRLASAEMTGRLKERSEIIDNPEKYGLQKPAEWGEEDEEKRKRIILLVEHAIQEMGGSVKYEEALEWLKSLRPQPKQEWSEEPMKHN